MKTLLQTSCFLMVLLLSACATRKEIVNFKNDSAYLRAQVDSLRAEQHRLWVAIQKLATTNERSTEAVSQWRADMQLQLTQLTEQTQLLSDRLEDTGRRIANLPAKIRWTAPSPAPAADTTHKVGMADTSQNGLHRQLEAAKQLYDAAYQDMVKGQYELARQGFMAYLRMQPAGDLADNAQYWIGECHYAQRKYDEAISAFETVLAKYPDGDKVPAAMLKLAYSQLALNQKTNAQGNLEALIRRFPQSNEATLARSRLQELQKSK
ncbi:MAG: tol-pal system protein YbgF [candidate division KSB1 bacterium]|nr:tol-pal system protein YbgF [candidate division KSB1 bacterium]